ncbi:sugar phosphate nucleotidyltransferase [Bdellovibrio sp. HCB337]|uniref:sugar phosphate nucleotidyltransferase n=1 Tax=Bdellovibrio sp. HCB337 TaxID=3394358 RepID=UPI0039A64415
MNVMLLAAGEGTRMRPYTLVRPKPALPFLNVPLASFPLAFLEGMKVDRLVVNTFYLPTKVVDLFIRMNHGARKLHFSHEINQILDSGGGLGFARDYFKPTDDLILMNSDEVILPLHKGILAQALAQHKANQTFCTLLTMDYPGVGTKFGGVWMDHKDSVRGFGKTPPGMDCVKAEHFIGIQILSGKVFEYLPKGLPSNILYDAVTKAIQEGHKVERYKVDCHWFESGNPEDFLKATESCLKILTSKTDSYPRFYLQELLKRFSAETPLVEERENLITLKTPSTSIANDVKLSGFAVLGADCKIQSGSELSNVVVADKIRVAPNTNARDLIFLEDN